MNKISKATSSLDIPLSMGAFDYQTIDTSIGNFLRGQAERIRRYASKSMLQIGKDLLEAKRYLSHGQFIQWVESEVGVPARTAQGYMHVAKWAETKSATFAHLSPSMLYLLSAKTTPPEVADKILSRIEAGEALSVAAVRYILKSSPRTIAQPQRATDGYDASISFPTQVISMSRDARPLLIEAIRILAHNLQLEDFVRVRELMTNRSLLTDDELPRKIESAFGSFEIIEGSVISCEVREMETA